MIRPLFFLAAVKQKAHFFRLIMWIFPMLRGQIRRDANIWQI